MNLRNMKMRFARDEEDEPPFSMKLSPRLKKIVETSSSIFARKIMKSKPRKVIIN
jgi:hypothetical protein